MGLRPERRMEGRFMGTRGEALQAEVCVSVKVETVEMFARPRESICSWRVKKGWGVEAKGKGQAGSCKSMQGVWILFYEQ